MTRIADIAASNAILNTVFRTQRRLHDLEQQVASGKLSQDYKGLARSSLRLVRLEAAKQEAERFKDNNQAMQLRVDMTQTTVEGMRTTLRDVRRVLLDIGSGEPPTRTSVEDAQRWAFNALEDLEAHLNTDIDGRYIFAGASVTTRPVDLGLTTLEAFQDRYDGASVIYPPTRDAHVRTDVELAPAATGGLTMSGGDTITAATPGAFARLKAGQTITLAGSSLGNDGAYTVVSTNGSDRITIAGALAAGATTIDVTNSVADGADAAVTIASGDYYRGDSIPLTHRVDDDRFLDLDLNAIDPAFEKAIRALGIIAQGGYGTAGGLDRNTGRIDDAIDLLNGALDRAGSGQPYGPELSGNLETAAMDLGFQQRLMHDAMTEQDDLVGFLTANIADIENVETLEAVTRLLDQGRALEAAYQAIAKVNALSLSDYL